jgi:predicted house-cleaning NTP pyrophosphatase (Maf/HAM1 superfamily)
MHIPRARPARAHPRALAVTLILASQSPRRAELLRMLGLEIETVPADIDETWRPGEDPAAHAERLAREKAQAVAARRTGCRRHRQRHRRGHGRRRAGQAAR